MLNYPPLHYSRQELSALAAKAQAGDSDAFVLLIRGTIRLYDHIAERLQIPLQYRHDVIQEAILTTYDYVLPRYQSGFCWVKYLGISAKRCMARSYRMISGPVTVSDDNLRAQATPLPDHAHGVVEPLRCRTAHTSSPTSAVEIVQRSQIKRRVQAELDRLDPRDRDAVLYVDSVASARTGLSRQALNQRKHKTLALLRKRLHDLHP